MATDIIIPYLKCRDQLPTFTIINCISKKFPYNWIGHTAILYKCTSTGQLMIFESTSLNKLSGKSGVQMMPFGARLDRYPGKVYARVPKFGDSSDGANVAREIMAADFIREHLGSSYPDLKTMTGRFKLYMAALDFKLFGKDWFSYKGGDKGIFCTELVMMMLQACGLYDDDSVPSEFKPDDLRGNETDFEDYLINMVYLPEIRLK
jgi:hypothetical protein